MNGVEPAGYFLAVGMDPFPNVLMEFVEGFDATSASTSMEMSSCADGPKHLIGGSDHAAVRAVRSFEVRLIQEPDPFPDLGDLTEVFGREDQLAGTNVRLRGKDRDDTPDIDHGHCQQSCPE